MSMHKNFSRTAIVVALSAIFPATGAYADDEVEALTNPNIADVSANLPYINKINPLYRQYNGINHEGLNGNANIDVVNRDGDGNWFKLYGQNLGLSTQEAGVSYEKQGDWAIGLEYNQIPRYSPYEVRTGVTGSGTNLVTQPDIVTTPVTPVDKLQDYLNRTAVVEANHPYEVTLKTQRDILSASAQKYLTEGLKLGFSFKNEEKNGARLFGVRGNSSTATQYSGFLFAPEPIDQNHKQFEATLDYANSKLQVTAGYYGSFLSTNNAALAIKGGTNTAVYEQAKGLTDPNSVSPVALAPDNQLHQFYVNGAYNFSADTRANLKVSYSQGRQNDDYINRGNINYYGVWSGTGNPWTCSAGTCKVKYNTTASSTPEKLVSGHGLDALVETTEVFGSLTSRLTKDLKILASWRYEDKKDKTDVRLTAQSYSLDSSTTPTAVLTSNYYNNPESHKANWGKLEADYRVGAGYAVTAGVDYREKSSDEWDRQRVQELTWRAALRKSMAETLNGTLSASHSERNGSDWRGIALAESIYPVYLADRSRDSVRGMLDWAPAENLSLQFGYEAYFDDYKNGQYGLDKGKGQVFSLDGSFAINDNWKLNAWYAKQTGDSKQFAQGAVCSTGNAADMPASSCTLNTVRTGAPLVQWDALLKLNSDQLGAGITGKVKSIDVGAQYLYSRDVNKQQISSMPNDTVTDIAPDPDTSTTVASGMGVLPKTQYTQNTFRLFAVYPAAKETKVRIDYIYDLRKMDDYTWSNFVYGDGTRVFVDPKQTTQIIGLSLIQSF